MNIPGSWSAITFLMPLFLDKAQGLNAFISQLIYLSLFIPKFLPIC
jgi:hypothetical protein